MTDPKPTVFELTNSAVRMNLARELGDKDQYAAASRDFLVLFDQSDLSTTVVSCVRIVLWRLRRWYRGAS